MTAGRLNWNDARETPEQRDAWAGSLVQNHHVRAITDIDETSQALSDLLLDVQGAQDTLALAIGAAKAAGMSWTQIGEAIDLTRQGAQQKYGRQAVLFLEADEQHRDRIFRSLKIGKRPVRYQIRVGSRRGELLSQHRDERVALREYVARLTRWDAEGRREKMPRCYKVQPGMGRNVKVRVLDEPALRKLGEKRAAKIMATAPAESDNGHTRGWLDDTEEAF